MLKVGGKKTKEAKGILHVHQFGGAESGGHTKNIL